jgi:hypothetical protein
VPEDIQPTTVEPSPAGLSITWSTPNPEPHTSFFPWSVLHKTSYHPILTSLEGFTSLKRSNNSATYDETDSHSRAHSHAHSHVELTGHGTIRDSERILWNASIAKSPPTVTYASLMGDEKSATQDKDKDKEEEGRERGMKRLLEKVVSTDRDCFPCPMRLVLSSASCTILCVLSCVEKAS